VDLLLTDEIVHAMHKADPRVGLLDAMLMQSAFCALPLLVVLAAIAAQ
jgi:hypothetical protein